MTEPGAGYRGQRFLRRLARRRRGERGLRLLGIAAIGSAVGMLGLLFGTILWQSRTAFLQTQLEVPIHFDPAVFEATGREGRAALEQADYGALVRRGLAERVGGASGRRERRELARLVSVHGGFRLRERVLRDPELVGSRGSYWVPASDDVDIAVKGVVPRDLPSAERRLSDRQLAWIEALERGGYLRVAFNRDLFLGTASRDPEVAGVLGAVAGSFFMLAVTLAFALPIGVGAAVYLECFAPRNRFTELIDVNLRNLAAVPSIVFGLLGLAFFIQVVGLPRSTPLVGGLVLGLMTLPTIVIAARAAIEAVPPSLYEAALQLGASEMQAVTLTVLPNALPGILTGTIIGMAQALGETAPLLMIGMVAFVTDVPGGLTDAAAPLPVQIFLWATSAERAFVEKTAAAIVVLLAFLLTMNGVTIHLRRRFERRW